VPFFVTVGGSHRRNMSLLGLRKLRELRMPEHKRALNPLFSNGFQPKCRNNYHVEPGMAAALHLSGHQGKAANNT
jgi:hypothetical protein